MPSFDPKPRHGLFPRYAVIIHEKGRFINATAGRIGTNNHPSGAHRRRISRSVHLIASALHCTAGAGRRPEWGSGLPGMARGRRPPDFHDRSPFPEWRPGGRIFLAYHSPFCLFTVNPAEKGGYPRAFEAPSIMPSAPRGCAEGVRLQTEVSTPLRWGAVCRTGCRNCRRS